MKREAWPPEWEQDPPKCEKCGEQHWPGEKHATAAHDKTEYVATCTRCGGRGYLVTAANGTRDIVCDRCDHTPDNRHYVPRRCAHKRCKRPVTQAFDVGSWFEAPEKQKLAHYEVCDKHASYFAGSFDRRQSEAVKKDLIEYEEAEAHA